MKWSRLPAVQQVALAVAGILGLLWSANAAGAEARRVPSEKGFYIGAGYDFTRVSGASFSGGDFLLGYHLNRHVAIEIGLIGAEHGGVTISNAYAEAQYSFGILPRTRMFLAAGGSYASVSASSSGLLASISQGGGRVGGGFDTSLGDSLSLRSSVYYQNALDDAVIVHFGFQLRI